MSDMADTVVNWYREKANSVVDHDDIIETTEQLTAAVVDNDFAEVLRICEEQEQRHDIDLTNIRTFADNMQDSDLVEQRPSNKVSQSLSEGTKTAIIQQLKARPGDKFVTKVNQEANQTSLQNLSEQLYNKDNKLAFMISPQKTFQGNIHQRKREHKENFDLLKVVEPHKDNNESLHEFVHFGEKADGRREVYEKLTGAFYVYDFVCEGEKYQVFSQQKLPLGRIELEGTIFSLDDSTKIGDSRNVSKTTDVIFVHSFEPAVYPLSEDEYERLKPAITHDWIMERMIGDWRQPEWFEKMLAASFFVNEEHGYPIHLMFFSEPSTGKSEIFKSLHRAMGESEEMMRGSRSTVKGLVPSFSGKEPDSGYLPKTDRVACVDEFFNLLQNCENKQQVQDAFRPMLDILLHDEFQSKSGNGSVTTKMDSMLLGGGNHGSYGLTSVLDMPKKLDEAWVSRVLMYQYTESHVQFITDRKPEMKRLIADKGDDVYPTQDDEFLSLLDMLREEVHLVSEVDFERVSEIKAELKDLVPDAMSGPYRERYDHHMENMLIGLAKYNSMVQSRDEFEIRDEDYEDMKAIFGTIIASWNEGRPSDMEALPPRSRLEFMPTHIADVYRIIDTNNKLSESELFQIVDRDENEVKVALNKLEDVGLIQYKEVDDREVWAPHWFDRGSVVPR